jgi:hypothetical protein
VELEAAAPVQARCLNASFTSGRLFNHSLRGPRRAAPDAYQDIDVEKMKPVETGPTCSDSVSTLLPARRPREGVIFAHFFAATRSRAGALVCCLVSYEGAETC